MERIIETYEKADKTWCVGENAEIITTCEYSIESVVTKIRDSEDGRPLVIERCDLDNLKLIGEIHRDLTFDRCDISGIDISDCTFHGDL